MFHPPSTPPPARCRPRTARRATAVAGFAGVALALVGCAGERSAEAYCETYDDGFAEIRREYPAIEDYDSANPLATFASLPSAMGDMTALLGEMAESAPEEVENDVLRLQETWEKQAETAGQAVQDPLGALAGSLAVGMTNAKAGERVDEYTVRHCGTHLFARESL